MPQESCQKKKKIDVMICVCNLGTVEAETGECLCLAA